MQGSRVIHLICGAYGRLFMATARLRSVAWTPLGMPLRAIIWYWALMVLFIIMRWLRSSLDMCVRFCATRQYPAVYEH